MRIKTIPKIPRREKNGATGLLKIAGGAPSVDAKTEMKYLNKQFAQAR
ncbi:hypothetical protein CFter6_5013 [Collimonas fungivorans]|uniref:Uncharacterized protein n=1 Tax=Collimonas fungivorans TaxID=158899 RepID=A0A127PIY3_9BURK|nr:hypothetical protein CFter6_5013 [Collimonas fungivorans]